MIEYGTVRAAGRGRWASVGADRDPAEVSGQMVEWLQVHGWIRWDLSGPMTAALVVLTRGPGAHGVRAVRHGAYRCNTCGRRWNEDTPAGRCPWEDVHPE